MLEKVLLVIFSFRNNELVCLVVHVVPLMALVTKCEIDSGGENQELKGKQIEELRLMSWDLFISVVLQLSQ